MKNTLLLVAFASLSVVACAQEQGTAADESNVTTLGQSPVSGYTFEGPKVSQGPINCSFFRQPDESVACDRLGGKSTIVEGCEVLCSVPIGTGPNIAGYDFDGFKIKKNGFAELCAQVISQEDTACGEAGGKATATEGCSLLCSVPIARKGQVAGFDGSAFRSAPARAEDQACPFETTGIPENACRAVGGQPRAAADCKTLCSLPF